MVSFRNFARIASLCFGFHLGTLHAFLAKYEFPAQTYNRTCLKLFGFYKSNVSVRMDIIIPEINFISTPAESSKYDNCLSEHKPSQNIMRIRKLEKAKEISQISFLCHDLTTEDNLFSLS